MSIAKNGDDLRGMGSKLSGITTGRDLSAIPCHILHCSASAALFVVISASTRWLPAVHYDVPAYKKRITFTANNV